MEVILSIGEVASRTGLSVSAIRYYETQGLVRSLRSDGRQRRFRRSDIRRLSFVIVAQRFGFTLERVRELLATLPQERTPNRSDWERIATGIRVELDERIASLTRLRDRLDGCIGCGCLSMEECGLYNPQDVAAKLGPGAQLVFNSKAASSEGANGNGRRHIS